MSVSDLAVAFVVEGAVDNRHYHADSNTKESKSTYPRRPPASFLVHDWKCGEQHIQRSIDDSHIDAEEQYDRLKKQEDPRP